MNSCKFSLTSSGVTADPGPDTDTQEEGGHVEAMLRQECGVVLTKKTGEASLWGEEAVKEDKKLTWEGAREQTGSSRAQGW